MFYCKEHFSDLEDQLCCHISSQINYLRFVIDVLGSVKLLIESNHT